MLSIQRSPSRLVVGLDALSSATYGPETALTLLIPLGLAGIQHIVPISFAIIGLLSIVFVSYLQTIEAYQYAEIKDGSCGN